MSLTLTPDDMARVFGCIWMVLITGLVIKGRLDLREHQAKKPNAPLPVDPDNPPTKGVFAWEPGDPETLCDCHGQPITDGQVIVCWPQPSKYTCSDADKGATK